VAAWVDNSGMHQDGVSQQRAKECNSYSSFHWSCGIPHKYSPYETSLNAGLSRPRTETKRLFRTQVAAHNLINGSTR